jgi:predicted PurR-regulated permease PerM
MVALSGRRPASSPVRHDGTNPLPRRAASRGPQRGGWTAILFAITVAALYLGRDVLVPLALAVLLSFVLAPLVLVLRRARVGRVASVLAAVLLAFLVILAVGALIGGQLVQLANNLPAYESTITDKIESVQGAATGSGIIARASSMLADLRREITRTAEKEKAKEKNEPKGGPAAPVTEEPKPVPVEIRQPPAAPLEVIRSLVGPLAGPLATAGIVIVFLFFILLQREDLRDRFIRLIGGYDLQRTTQALDDGVTRLSRYFLMQSAINVSFGVLIGIGLFFIGVPNPLLWGIIATLLRIVPYIGAWIAAFFPVALALAVDPGWSMVLWTLALFAVVELLMGQAVEPLLNAHSTGLSAVAIVIAAAFWTWLWGPVGLVVSTPLTVCLVVIGRHVEQLAFLNVLLGDGPALAPEERFYQRILAGDADEAAQQAEAFLKEKPLTAYYDEIAMPGLVLAQADASRGVLDHEARIEIKEAIEGLIDNLFDYEDSAGRMQNENKQAQEPPEPRPGSASAHVLCVAGRGPLDEAAAAMLTQILGRHRVGARVVSGSAVLPANLYRLKAGNAATVCLSYLPPITFTHARYLVRRLRRRLPGAKMVLCLWNQSHAEIDRDDARSATGADLVVTSLDEAVDLLKPVPSFSPVPPSEKDHEAAIP